MSVTGIASRILWRKTISFNSLVTPVRIPGSGEINSIYRRKFVTTFTVDKNMPPVASLAGTGGSAKGGGGSITAAEGSTEITDKQHIDISKLKPPPVLKISVDGNISSGKSTLVSTLVDILPTHMNFQVEVVPEPLEKWTNLKGHNLLDKLYKDVAKNNFMFQHFVQLTRLMDTIKAPSDMNLNGYAGTIRIMERSLTNNRYCFSELARRQGTLQEAEFAVLAEWYKWLGEKMDLSLDLIIYLRTSPETVFTRMKSRGRAEESTVPLEYLSALHDTYEDWLVNNSIPEEAFDSQKKRHVIVIDANQTKENVAQQCRLRIQEFLDELTTGEADLNK